MRAEAPPTLWRSLEPWFGVAYGGGLSPRAASQSNGSAGASADGDGVFVVAALIPILGRGVRATLAIVRRGVLLVDMDVCEEGT